MELGINTGMLLSYMLEYMLRNVLGEKIVRGVSGNVGANDAICSMMC